MPRDCTFWVSLIFGLVLVSGCGETPPKLFPVSGKVIVNGKPADRALVTFYVQTESGPAKARSFAITGADGAFRAFTFKKDDGVPAGDYAVTITLPQYGNDDDDEPGPDLLDGRYADPRSGKLKIQIHERDNELEPFQLTGP